MRTKVVIIDEPFARCDPSRDDVGETVRVKKLVANLPLNDSTWPFCVGFPGSMKCRATLCSAPHLSIARLVNSSPWSNRIVSGRPRSQPIASNTRKTRCVGSMKSTSTESASRVKSSISVRTRICRPFAERIVNEIRRPTLIGPALPAPRACRGHSERDDVCARELAAALLVDAPRPLMVEHDPFAS